MSVDEALGPMNRRKHWQDVYRRNSPAAVSWYQREPRTSLDLIEGLDLPRDAALLDVGGGASTLVDHLAAEGFTDISVLDLSDEALRVAADRLGNQPGVRWIREDLLDWEPNRRYDLWHDRAVFHFFVDPVDRDRYLRVLRSALQPNGTVVLATFAPEGPERCSGLPVTRWSPQELDSFLGQEFEVVERRREEHETPSGGVQPFTWVVARRSEV